MPKGPFLFLQQISDRILQRNFVALQEYLRLQSLLEDFKFYEIIFDSAQTNFRYKHGLSFIPKDLIVTRIVGEGNVTFNFDDFTTDELDMTTDGACEIRFFAGVYSG